RLRRTRSLVCSIDQSGLSIAAIVMFSASWIVTQLSTSVLSQSNRIARGRSRRLDAASSVDGPLTSATPTRAILASLSGRIFEYPSGALACIFRLDHFPVLGVRKSSNFPCQRVGNGQGWAR